MANLKEEIKKFVLENSYFEDASEDDDDFDLRFTTRMFGDVAEETPGREDWKEMMRMSFLLNQKFPNQVKCDGETVDEWTDLLVTII